MDQPVLLQLCPFSSSLETDLAASFEVCRFFELDEPDAWLSSHGPAVVAIATGGHIGAPNALIDRLPALGIIAVNGVGVDKVDLDLARQRGIRVTTTPGILSNDVADLAVGLIIALLRGIPQSDAFVRAGSWPEGDRPLARTVTGRTYGIVGLGEIGAALAARLAAFGPVLYTGPREKPVPYGFVADLHSLARQSDVLTCSANAVNAGMVDRSVLAALGSDGYLVNVARGSLIDEPALIAALSDGTLAGAALDVFADEPRVPSALYGLANAVLTPHIASATIETRARMADRVIENLRAWLAGTPLPSARV
jgi:lactate dehydrogenase-like 2-hydroxyacid dehydrogenase